MFSEEISPDLNRSKEVTTLFFIFFFVGLFFFRDEFVRSRTICIVSVKNTFENVFRRRKRRGLIKKNLKKKEFKFSDAVAPSTEAGRPPRRNLFLPSSPTCFQKREKRVSLSKFNLERETF